MVSTPFSETKAPPPSAASAQSESMDPALVTPPPAGHQLDQSMGWGSFSNLRHLHRFPYLPRVLNKPAQQRYGFRFNEILQLHPEMPLSTVLVTSIVTYIDIWSTL